MTVHWQASNKGTSTPRRAFVWCLLFKYENDWVHTTNYSRAQTKSKIYLPAR